MCRVYEAKFVFWFPFLAEQVISTVLQHTGTNLVGRSQ